MSTGGIVAAAWSDWGSDNTHRASIGDIYKTGGPELSVFFLKNALVSFSIPEKLSVMIILMLKASSSSRWSIK